MLLTRDSLQIKRPIQTESEVLHTNENQKKAEVAILMSDKIDSKIKTVTRDKKDTT